MDFQFFPSGNSAYLLLSLTVNCWPFKEIMLLYFLPSGQVHRNQGIAVSQAARSSPCSPATWASGKVAVAHEAWP